MLRMLVAGIFAFAAHAALAQVTVKDAWVRATVPHQSATGAFMKLESPQDARLVSASSAAAGVVEIHQMTMDNGVMKMRPVKGVDIPVGKVVELKPGGYHVMMMNLKDQVKEGDVVPITLVVEGKDKQRQTLEVRAVARPLNAAGGGEHSGMQMKH